MNQPIRMTSSERENYARGRERFLRGDVDGAMNALSQLLETREGFADVHYMIGVLRERQGDDEGAADSLRRAIRLNPSYAEALLALASVHEGRGDFERSRELAERAATVSRGAPGVLDATTRGKLANLQAAVGDAYAEAGETREAIDAYRKALDRCPEFHDIRFRLAVVLRGAGLPDRALRELKRVLRGNPDYLEAQVQLGLTYYTLGRTQDAVDQWAQTLERDPSREDARMYGRLVRAGRTSEIGVP
jgi:tetratricopeptide (TPR) repeat protein